MSKPNNYDFNKMKELGEKFKNTDFLLDWDALEEFFTMYLDHSTNYEIKTFEQFLDYFKIIHFDRFKGCESYLFRKSKNKIKICPRPPKEKYHNRKLCRYHFQKIINKRRSH